MSFWVLTGIQISWVVNIMKSKGAEVYVLDYFEDAAVDLLVFPDGSHKLIYDGEVIPQDLVIWDRKKLVEGMYFAPSGETKEDKRIADLRRKE